MRSALRVVPVLVAMLITGVGVLPGQAQQPADVTLVNALPGITVDVDIDGVTVAESLAYGETVPGDGLGLETNEQVEVEVREAGTSTVLGGTEAPSFVPDFGAMMVHYADEDVVRVTLHEYCIRLLCDGVAAVDAWVFADAGPVDIRIDGEVVTPSEECGSAGLPGEPGEYEVAFLQAGSDTVLAGPEPVTVAEGEVAVVYLTGSRALGNLQPLTLGYTLQTQDCTPRQPAPTGPRPAGDLPDVQILQAIPNLTVEVQLGRRFVESLGYGQQFNDDELGGIAGDRATITVRELGEVLVGPVEVPITSDAGTVAIHRDGQGQAVLTYFEDPVQTLCEDEGALALRNASALFINWVVGTGPIDDTVEGGAFPALLDTGQLDSGEQQPQVLAAADYLGRVFNFVNGEPASGIEDLDVESGRVTTAYFVGGTSAGDPGAEDLQTLVLGYGVATKECPLPATPTPKPTPPRPPGEVKAEQRYFATPADTPQDGF